ncbi:MAG: hypothetical protein RQ758_03095 [Methanomicrobiaceae archaeon]|nr:hypothetical protein [Methanomicrobiaceae archaeon]
MKAGTIALGEGGVILVEDREVQCEMGKRDLEALMDTFRTVPLTRVHPGGGVSIEGQAGLNGSSIRIVIRGGSGELRAYAVPIASFLRVVRGEAVSAPLFPVESGE